MKPLDRRAALRRGTLLLGGLAAPGLPAPGLLAPGLLAPGLLRAQTASQGGWRPSQAIRLVVPAAAAGTTDIMGRMLAPLLQERWGQPAVVDNRSGAGGTLGAAEVARAKPDGHTVLISNIGPQAIAYSLFRNLPYRPEQFAPVSNMILGPNALMVHPSVPARTVPEFVRYMKEKRGRLNYCTSGPGQSGHLSCVWFQQLTGTQATAVHFRGAGPGMLALVAGDVDFTVDNLTTAVEQIRAGKVRALAVTSADRNAQLPEVPAMRETMPELAAYDMNTWFGAFLPAGTPEPAVVALNGAIRSLLELPATRQRFAEMGGVPAYGTPAEYAAFVAAETEKWGRVVRQEGLQMEIG